MMCTLANVWDAFITVLLNGLARLNPRIAWIEIMWRRDLHRQAEYHAKEYEVFK